jgi:DNA polymerase-4
MDTPWPATDPPLGWLYVDLNSYFASVEQHMQPHLRGRPVAVVPVMSRSTCAIAASAEAKRFGVKTGTRIFEAERLCPDLVLVPARHQLYVEYHQKIVAAIDRHLPVDRVCSIDEVACRLSGSQCAEPRALSIARAIKHGICADVGECLTSSVGIAPNRFLAKVATKLQKPDGLVVLRPCDLPQRLADRPLRFLPGIGANMERRLAQAGIGDFASLWALSTAAARRAWGSIEGERFVLQLHGAEVSERASVRRSIGHSRVLEPALRPAAEARLVARRLLVKAAVRLRRYGLAARTVGLSVRGLDGERRAAEMRLPAACQDRFAFLQALDGLWAAVRRDYAVRAYKKIGVTLAGLAPLGDPPPDLFANPQAARLRAKREALLPAIDRLTRRYGRDAVSFGLRPGAATDDLGTKIAFTRIPEIVEFGE